MGKLKQNSIFAPYVRNFLNWPVAYALRHINCLPFHVASYLQYIIWGKFNCSNCCPLARTHALSLGRQWSMALSMTLMLELSPYRNWPLLQVVDVSEISSPSNKAALQHTGHDRISAPRNHRLHWTWTLACELTRPQPRSTIGSEVVQVKLENFIVILCG